MNELGSGSSTDPPVTTDRSIAMQPLAARGPIAVQDKLLSMLHQNRDYALVRAPFNGVITQHKVGVGSLVHRNASTGAFMFEVMQRDVIRAFFCVPQDAAFGMAPGVDVIVRIPKIPNREFLGNVTRIADALQSGTPTLLTEIDIPSPDNALAPGAYCPVELTIPRPTPSFVVPAEAIIFNRNGLQLARVTDGKAEICKLSAARDFGTWVEADAGVTSGEQVILNPSVTPGQLPCVEPNPGVAGRPAVSGSAGQLEMRYG
jgi:multidrug efflux pump subunit AcrA (membrane-fusion protein)